MLLIRHLVRLVVDVVRFSAGERSPSVLLILAPVALVVAVGIAVSVAAPVIYPFI